MKNYIYLMVNTSERAGQRVASKFGVKYIPAFAITNAREVKLKFVENYLNVDQLVKWLDNPSMYDQPLEFTPIPDDSGMIGPQPERRIDRRPWQGG